MAITEFSAALNQVAIERGISVDSIIESIQTALVSAYKKDYEVELEDELDAKIDAATGEASIFKNGKDVTPSGFGRIAAQTAKQVILQKIRETEKDVILNEFKGKVGEIILGHVFRIEHGLVILDLGKAHGIMPQPEQVNTENYRVNQKIKVLIKDIREGNRGTEIIVSRSSEDFVKKLFEQEVPEIASAVVKIESIAREPGFRTKMAVSSTDEKVDPVGSCVGQKGVRVQSIINELFGEKIDIIPYSTSIEKYIASSLSPAKVSEVELDQENKRALVTVPEDQQSLAIGKEGQNARLANKLTRWRIDIKGAQGVFDTGTDATDSKTDEKKSKDKKRGIWDDAIAEQEDKKEKIDPIEASEVEEIIESDVVDQNQDDNPELEGEKGVIDAEESQ